MRDHHNTRCVLVLVLVLLSCACRAERPARVSASATASRTEIGLVYVAAVVQGLALVTFPAASSIFTSPDGFGFDSTRYGALFLPQVLLAILASAFAPRLARRWSLRRVLLAGLAGDIVSMTLLALSRLLLGMPDMAFGVLLLATGALGLGFGATVMALNTYAEAFFPKRADRAVLALNALLGLGTALAPVLVAIVVALGAWWLLPVVVACIAVLLFGVAYAQPLRTPRRQCRRRPADLAQLDRSAAPLLALCRRRICLRDRGNLERQLGDALSQQRAGRIDPGSLVRARRLLGDGDGWTRPHRADLSAGAAALDLCRAPRAVAGGVSTGLAGPERSWWDHRFRPRRPGVLGISAVEHQLRGRGVSPSSRP